ncbi:MAG: 3-oxoacyl-[acyl-carrier-protein] synthase [Pseudonocardiales bacterium]|nr:3-oxoacyl-[acyl-carrier-protein] synthase [Pseudonocardiales bacterium]
MTSKLGARPHATSTDPALSGARLLGVGAAQPDRTVSASELGEPFGRTADWVRARTGIDAVRRTEHEDEIERLAARAAASALARAGIAASDVDLVLTASCSLDRPATCRIAAAVAPYAGWMAINAACSGFCFAVSSADNLIRTGMTRHVLIVAAEQMSALLDPADLGTSIIFGDGAGAAYSAPRPPMSMASARLCRAATAPSTDSSRATTRVSCGWLGERCSVGRSSPCLPSPWRHANGRVSPSATSTCSYRTRPTGGSSLPSLTS